ncbi:hypothetical protein EPI10_010813 [Gossypium australe]|uniref:Uncharacterized protein n=1 Tax=Gossypium australe TaxID=47621 RepID=A0A5B6W598_9ROSI|nr:hypothetical protein EPI10_010813 [Gossypium australe]
MLLERTDTKSCICPYLAELGIKVIPFSRRQDLRGIKCLKHLHMKSLTLGGLTKTKEELILALEKPKFL